MRGAKAVPLNIMKHNEKLSAMDRCPQGSLPVPGAEPYTANSCYKVGSENDPYLNGGEQMNPTLIKAGMYLAGLAALWWTSVSGIIGLAAMYIVIGVGLSIGFKYGAKINDFVDYKIIAGKAWFETKKLQHQNKIPQPA